MISTLAGALALLSTVVMPGATYDAYSYTQPDAMPGVALIGGWATKADIGPDQLYWTRAGEIQPHPLVWANAPLVAHLNDPTVIAGPRGELLMYYTALPNVDATAAEMDLENHIGMAISYDGGAMWWDRGIIVEDGWSPSALVIDGTPFLFWHTNGSDPVVKMTVLQPGGYVLPGDSGFTLQGVDAVNVSVARLADGSFLLVGNGIGPNPFYDIVAYRSVDLLNWEPFQPGNPILINAGAAQLLTPEVKQLPGGAISLTFTEVVSPSETVTMRWEIEL